MGSIFYMAPEVLKASYTEKCDVWSLGVILFAMFTKRFPFDDEDPDNIPGLIIGKKFRFKRTDKVLIPKKIRKFLKMLLDKNYQKRPDAKMTKFELMII